MKQLLISVLCGLVILLSACSNKPASQQAQSPVLPQSQIRVDDDQNQPLLIAKESPHAKTRESHTIDLPVLIAEEVSQSTSEKSDLGQSVRQRVLQTESELKQFNAYKSMTTQSAAVDSAISAMPVAAPTIRPASEPVDRENYLHFEENGIKLVVENPVSTFSVDVDTAAYSNIRRMLEREGRIPPKDAIKIEELINYFSYDYPAADSLDAPFSVATEIAPAPWNAERYLLQIGLKGYQPQSESRPPANLVFLIDVSGSMQSNDKLGLVKRSLRLLVDQMNPDDRIALVVYAGAAGMVLDSTPVSHRGKILSAIEMLQAGGSTNGGAGIRLAYDVAQGHFIDQGINRVIIASDGDMNVGTVGIEALKNLIENKRQSGIALTTLGFGTGNYNYALMEQIADVGNGNAAYIDSIKEAQKVLVNEINSTLLTIAKDVKVQIEFNPDVVAQYRLIGYENRILNREDFRNDKVDAGDIGAGHTVTALYEVALVNSRDQLIPSLRYSINSAEQESHNKATSDLAREIAYVRLRYKQPNSDQSQEIGQPVTVDNIMTRIESASPNLRFAAAVAGFGQLLRGGKFTRDWSYDDALKMANQAKGADQHGYRGEFIGLVQLAKSFSPRDT